MAAIPANARTGFGDVQGLAQLRQAAEKDPKQAVKEAARQFESLFMQQMLKTMRESSQNSGLFDNEGSKLGQEMLDTQWSTKVAGQPGGLSDLIARQLERQMGMAPGPIPKDDRANKAPTDLAKPGAKVQVPQQAAATFIGQHTQAAQAAEASTGVPAAFMISQAALETGWGRKDIRNADGSPSYNLFGIKAGSSWKGATTDVVTTEYVNGQARKVVQRFRAYASHAESFADYARLIKDSPRYAKVIENSQSAQGFAQGLQKAGYATDPAYAEKLTKVINTTLRLQRSLA